LRLKITAVAKVFGQNICPFFSHIKATGESQKQLVRLRIFCSFGIWAQKLCVYFSSIRVRESLKDIKIGLSRKQTEVFVISHKSLCEDRKFVGVGDFVERTFLYKT
jgi:hypothetical protein